MKSRFDVVVHGSALYVEVSFSRAMDLKYLNNIGEVHFIEPSENSGSTQKKIETQNRTENNSN